MYWSGKSVPVVFLAVSVFAASCQRVSEPTHVPLRTEAMWKSLYHGWSNADFLSNGTAVVVVVPAIGRVMQFAFVDRNGNVEEEPFWNNRALDGEPPDPNAKDWVNFGGDKTWPAPQHQWRKIEGRAWPPPPAFDSMPMTSSPTSRSVQIVSALDPKYGIRLTRKIDLDKSRPVMTIATTYEKVRGNPVRVAVWVTTQLTDPERIFFVLPNQTKMPQGFVKLMGTAPFGLEREGKLLSLRRDLTTASKIGTEATTLIWIGENAVLEIQNRFSSPRAAVNKLRASSPASIERFPDGGSSSEVYTNPDPLQYVELEMLGPLRTMRVGDRITQTNTYTLIRRSHATPDAEARALVK